MATIKEEDLSDEQLTSEIKDILKTSGLQISSKIVLQKLEKKLNLDLSEQKKKIYRMVMDIVDSMESEEENASESEASSEEEVVVKKEVVKKEVVKKEAKPKNKAKKRKKGSDEEEDNSNDSDWGGGGGGGGKRAGGGGGGGARKRKSGGGGYTRAYKLSPALAELMGETELPRHEVVKRVWAIIKEKQLFDPKNRQFAICDKALYKVIGIQRFRTFGMMKYLKNHFLD